MCGFHVWFSEGALHNHAAVSNSCRNEAVCYVKLTFILYK